MTPHFSKEELACKCGCGMLPAKDFIEKLEAIRVVYAKPMRVNSAARCPEYNDKLYQKRGEPAGTHLSGPHTTGRAIDIGVSGHDAHELLRIAMRVGYFRGVGVSQKGPHASRLLHFDDIINADGQPRPWIWSY
jgi:uncharacterized protein YcbK (DUF882 family)